MKYCLVDELFLHMPEKPFTWRPTLLFDMKECYLCNFSSFYSPLCLLKEQLSSDLALLEYLKAHDEYLHV